MSRYSLRPYQQRAIARTLAAAAAGTQRILISLPTGTGKTFVAVHLVAAREGRCLWLVHRDELVDQAIETLAEVLPGVAVGVVKAARDETDTQIVVASIQTLSRPKRLARLLHKAAELGRPFGVVVCDEAHHSLAESWLAVLYGLRGLLPDYVEMGRVAQAYADAGRPAPSTLIPSRASVPGGPLVIGLTATPERGDGKGMDAVWQLIGHQESMLAMITQGYLCDVRALVVGDLDLAGVRRTMTNHGRDLDPAQLSDRLLALGVPHDLARAYVAHAAGRTALVFVPSVAMAHATREAFRQAGVAAELVTATTPREERRRHIAALRQRLLPVLVNVGVLTEGFDAPAVDCILVGRPTESRPLYTQMIGRGTRTHPDKADLLVLEFTVQNQQHKIQTVESLLGRPLVGPPPSPRDPDTALPEPADGTAAVVRAHRTAGLNLFARLAWTRHGAGRYSLATGRGPVVWLRPAGVANTAQMPAGWLPERCVIERRQGNRIESLFDGRVLRTDYAQGLVEELARQEGWYALADAAAPWRARPASPRQRARLDALGLSLAADDDTLSAGDASALISRTTAGVPDGVD